MSEHEIPSGAKSSKNSNPIGNDHFLKANQDQNQHHLTRQSYMTQASRTQTPGIHDSHHKQGKQISQRTPGNYKAGLQTAYAKHRATNSDLQSLLMRPMTPMVNKNDDIDVDLGMAFGGTQDRNDMAREKLLSPNGDDDIQGFRTFGMQQSQMY